MAVLFRHSETVESSPLLPRGFDASNRRTHHREPLTARQTAPQLTLKPHLSRRNKPLNASHNSIRVPASRGFYCTNNEPKFIAHEIRKWRFTTSFTLWRMWGTENNAFVLSSRRCLSKRVPHTEPLTLLSQSTMTASAPSFATPQAFLPKRENG
jgi:hypothetical protein